LRQQAPFPRVAGDVPAVPSGAPRLGAHTREVLGELGVDGSALDAYAREGVV
jgi:crotonobetainyl-CoA:carnitine CoA-transferase CaiB-like acyl-CoA transferase